MKKSLFILLLFGVAFQIQGAEAIKEFDTHVVINRDSTITVTENISVMVEGKQIKRGLFRDIPLKRKSKKGVIETIALKVLSVRRDNRVEKFSVKPISGGMRIKIGNKNHYLKKGIHDYEIIYQTTRQLRNQGNGKTELFWNITGNGWSFPIEKSSASFELNTNEPQSLVFFIGYTGKIGQREKNFKVINSAHSVKVETTKELKAKEGWSIAVQFPSDQVKIPSFLKALVLDLKIMRKTRDLFWVVVALFFSFGVWYIHGIDPKRKSIIPHFKSPKDFSPAKLNYIYLGRYSNDAISSALINMAVKGAITISHEGKIEVTPVENNEEALKTLSSEEKILYDGFCRDGGMVLSKSNRSALIATKKEFTKNLKEQSKPFHSLNLTYSFLAGGGAMLFYYFTIKHLGVEGIVSFIGFIEYLVLGIVLGYFFFRRSTDSKFKTLFTMLFVSAFITVHGYMFGVLFRGGGILDGFIFALFTIPTGLFISVMPSPSKKGQRLIDQIDGFRMYLSYAETDRLDKLNPPELSPEVFEKLLPFAHALGEENRWADYFQKRFVALQSKSYSYSPYWYRGSYASFDISSMGSTIGSTINSAMSSSTGSSSSSSSGGGGGGGGGGGW